MDYEAHGSSCNGNELGSPGGRRGGKKAEEEQLRSQTQEELENIKSTFLKEIVVVQIQAASNNLILGKMEQMM